MTGVVQPIGGGQRRLPQAGRIRIGEKVGKAGMRAINTFRFTSSDNELLAPLAALYGGEVKAWDERKSGDRYELRTDASKISVVLPPDALSESYELWTGGGMQRSCDGYQCGVNIDNGDSIDVNYVDCLCEQKGVLECKYKLRLRLILPEVESLGVWRLDTSSQYAREEIPGVVETIETLQGRGLYRATLSIQKRKSGKKHYNVPVLDPGVSLDALASGGATVFQLPRADPPQLGVGVEEEEEPGRVGQVSPSSTPPIDDVIDAEIVTTPDMAIARAWLANLPTKERNHALKRAHAIADEHDHPLPTSAAAIDDFTMELLALELMPDE